MTTHDTDEIPPPPFEEESAVPLHSDDAKVLLEKFGKLEERLTGRVDKLEDTWVAANEINERMLVEMQLLRAAFNVAHIDSEVATKAMFEAKTATMSLIEKMSEANVFASNTQTHRDAKANANAITPVYSMVQYRAIAVLIMIVVCLTISVAVMWARH